jgi:hypothetical protein
LQEVSGVCVQSTGAEDAEKRIKSVMTEREVTLSHCRAQHTDSSSLRSCYGVGAVYCGHFNFVFDGNVQLFLYCKQFVELAGFGGCTDE